MPSPTDMSTPLPGRWIDFGDDLLELAAHPTRPWLALLFAHHGRPPTVEHHDLATGAVLSIAEVPEEGVHLEWVGDRAVLIASTPRPNYVDAGCHAVDVAYLRVPPEMRPRDERRREPGSLPLETEDGAQVLSYRIVQGREGLAVVEFDRTHCDGALLVWDSNGTQYAATRFGPTEGDCPTTIDLGDGQTIARISLPDAGPDRLGLSVGWSGPDTFLVLEREGEHVRSGPHVLWRIDTRHRTATPVALDDGWCVEWADVFSDGTVGAVVSRSSNGTFTEALATIDAWSGRFEVSPMELKRSPILVVELRQLSPTVLSCWSELPNGLLLTALARESASLSHWTVSMPRESLRGPWGRPEVHILGEHRVLLRDADAVGRCFVSDPLFERAP